MPSGGIIYKPVIIIIISTVFNNSIHDVLFLFSNVIFNKNPKSEGGLKFPGLKEYLHKVLSLKMCGF